MYNYFFGGTMSIFDEVNSARSLMEYNEKQRKQQISNPVYIHVKENNELPKEKETNGKLGKGSFVQTAYGSYTLGQKIGAGGNGQVFEAKDTDGEVVAIKFLEKNKSAKKLKRFKNEINFCENHPHKNIVQILDRGYARFSNIDYAFYVMPKYEKTLRQKMKDGMTSEEKVQVFIGILDGLKFAHEHEAIHRDIKPENILFKENSNEPVICDFGIAHFAEEELLTLVETNIGDRMANFWYAAPEQYSRNENKVFFSTDIYSAALILNEMFTGEIPKASGYKKIGDFDEEYKYLDEIFERLFKQNPAERLYPEDKIITEMKLLAEKYKNEKEIARLQSVIDESITPVEFVPEITGMNINDDGDLVLQFDRDLPREWCDTIIDGNYDCGFFWGYEHNKLRRISVRELVMPIRGINESELKTLVGHIKGWVTNGSALYNSNVKKALVRRQREEESARKEEIKRLESQNRLNDILAGL